MMPFKHLESKVIEKKNDGDLPEEEKNCLKCGHKMHEMKVEICKELKVIPTQVVVVHHKSKAMLAGYANSRVTPI
jgi:hypothetical protein